MLIYDSIKGVSKVELHEESSGRVAYLGTLLRKYINHKLRLLKIRLVHMPHLNA